MAAQEVTPQWDIVLTQTPEGGVVEVYVHLPGGCSDHKINFANTHVVSLCVGFLYKKQIFKVLRIHLMCRRGGGIFCSI